jgi:hypothetical protein
MGELKISSFNLLAPCYKRLHFGNSGNSVRESANQEIWEKRLADAIGFFNSYLLKTSQIIALQEYWMEDMYTQKFHKAVADNGYKKITKYIVNYSLNY